ncbi:MAG: GAF domain-containing protein [Candidatus Cloacimonetes bacterium]|nr:GAF domain-containing protein [Candidatus Cloacimonadota bacterium]
MPKILVIEDEEDQLFILKEILTSLISECKVITAQSGEEGIIKIKKELPDTILLDIKLPKMDGYEVCKILKSDELTKNIPIIMITGVYKDTESRIKALDSGVDAFLTKPIEPGELEAQVNVMLRIKNVEDKLKQEKDLLDELVQERTKELIESEQLNSAIIEDSPIGISVRDKNGTLLIANKAWQKLWGLTKKQVSEFTKKRTKLKFDERDSYLGKYINDVKKVYENGEECFIPEIKLFMSSKNQAEWISQHFYAVKDEKGNIYRVVILTEDITEQKHAEQTQSVLYNISNAINTTKDLNELFKKIHTQLGKIIDTTNFYIALYDKDTNIISVPYYVDQLFKETPSQQILGDSLTAYIIHSAKSLYLTVEKREKLIKEGKIAQADWKSKIWLGVPLKIENQVIGAIAVKSYTDASQYSEKDLEIIEFVSDQIALAIARKQADKSLRESEEKYRLISENTNDLITISSFSLNPIYTYVSHSIKNLDYEPEDLIGKPCFDYIHPEDKKKLLSLLKKYVSLKAKKLLTGKEIDLTEKIEFRARDKSGNWHFLESTVNLINDKILYVTRDITERKKAEQIKTTIYNIANVVNTTKDLYELFKAIQHYLSTIIDTTNFYIALYDKESDTISLLYHIDEKDKFTSCPAGKTLTAYVIKTGKPLFGTEEVRERLIQAGKVERGKVGAHAKIWVGVPLRIEKEIIGVIAVQSYTDASLYSEKDLEILEFVSEQIAIAIARKQTDEALLLSEERYRTMIENANDMIWILDTNGNFTFINHQSELVTGHNIKDLIGKSFVPLIHPDDLEIVNEVFQKTLLGESQRYIIRIFDKNKEQLYLSVNTAPIYEKDKIVRTVSFGRDITEQKHSEQLQSVLYNIANAVHTTKEINELYSSIRNYLSKIIDTTNFFVALYDKETDTISLPYDINEKDKFTSFPAGKTFTSYVLRTKKSLLADEEVSEKLTQAGEVELVGTPSKIWLGVPLKVENEVIGVVAVQSYTDPTLYKKKDLEILEFVSEQIALAIERKKATEKIKHTLDEKIIMLQEIHHRVKNNMQIIMSLLRLQARYFKDKDIVDKFQTIQNRIKSMALIHEKLYQSKDFTKIDFGKYIRGLTTHLLHSYRTEISKIKLDLNIKDVSLGLDKGIPCGFIINELVANALKHAFPEGAKGTVSINMHPIRDDKYSLIISDDGIGFPKDLDFQKTETLGMQLVNDLTKQIDGIIILNRTGGTTFKIVF